MGSIAHAAQNGAHVVVPAVDDVAARLQQIVSPPTACPCCYIEQNPGQPFPGHYSTRLCEMHRAAIEARSAALKQH